MNFRFFPETISKWNTLLRDIPTSSQSDFMLWLSRRYYFPLLHTVILILKKNKKQKTKIPLESGWQNSRLFIKRKDEVTLSGFLFLSSLGPERKAWKLRLKTVGYGSATNWVLEQVKLTSLALHFACVIQKYFMVSMTDTSNRIQLCWHPMKWHFIVLAKFVLFMEHISNKVLVLKIHGWPDMPHPLIMSRCCLLGYWNTNL